MRYLIVVDMQVDFINGAWQIIEVGKEKCDDESLRLVIDIPELRIHGNAGCNIVNGQLLMQGVNRMDVTELSAGVYVVKTASTTAKIVIK